MTKYNPKKAQKDSFIIPAVESQSPHGQLVQDTRDALHKEDNLSIADDESDNDGAEDNQNE